MLESLLTYMVWFSWLFWLVACWQVRGFFHENWSGSDQKSSSREEAGPNHEARCWQEEQALPFTPPVSVLKPVRGVDHQAYENFASFCMQDYPEYEIIFGVADPDDPVLDIIARVREDFPHKDIRVVIAPAFGSNRKASILHKLANEARYEILVVSDSDIRVSPDYLRRVVAPLKDPDVGLVTCPYVGDVALSIPAKLEALHMNVTFLPSVVVASRLPWFKFALGASVALRKRDLALLGGFKEISDYLADDYEIGARIASLGLRVQLSNCIVSSILGRTTFQEEWHREVRWARCNKVSRPVEYPGLLLTMSTPLAGALTLLTGLSPQSQQILLASLCLRTLAAYLTANYIGHKETRKWLALLPVRDILSFLVWVSGLFGKRIVWRGEEFILEEGGKMRPLGCQDE